MKRTVLAAGGLATDPNPFITAPQGALRRADEVIFKHPDVASLRPSFSRLMAQGVSRRPRAIYLFNGGPVVVAVDGSTWTLENTSATTLHSDAEPPDNEISPTQFVEARGNLYYTTIDGVFKLTSDSDTDQRRAGLLEVPSVGTSIDDSGHAASRPIQSGYRVAYRACVARRDANGVDVRSAPSPWALCDNTAAGDRHGVVSVPLTADVIAGDVVEVYRSQQVASPSSPSDVLFLAAKHTVTSADVTAGYASIADYTLEEMLGAELYTNSTREGALKANYMPPIAVALASFGNCIWYGNTDERHTLGIRILRVDTGTTPSKGLSFIRTTATGTSGTPTITVASAAGLHTGMYVYNDAGDPESAGTDVPANTTIATIAGTTVTLSANLTSDLAAETLNFSDRITVDGSHFFTTGTSGPSMSIGDKYIFLSGTSREEIGETARNLAIIVTLRTGGPSVYAYGTEDSATAGSIIFRREARDASAFTVSTTAPAGAVVSLASDGSLTSTRVTKANRVYYSKPDEPEHVPVVNYVSVGGEGGEILAMARSRNALLVFKQDGIFKITGSAPDGWRVDEVDTATRVLRGSCVAEMNGIVYAWTNRGAVAVTELGVRNLSARAISRELDEYAFNMYEEPGTRGAYVVAWPAAGLVLFGVPAGEGAEDTSHIYVFSESTGRWSRWAIETYCAASNASAIYLAKSDMFEMRVNVGGAVAEVTTGFDASYGLSAWTYTAGTTTISVADADRGTWTPRAGDYVSASIGGTIYYRKITDAADAGASYTLTIDEAFPSGAQSSLTAYEGITATLEWQPVTSGDPFSKALWREVQASFDFDDVLASTYPDPRFELGATCERTTTTDPADSKECTASIGKPAPRSSTLRAGLDREVGRANQCSAWISGSNLGTPWHCRGVALVYTPDGGDAERGSR